MNKNLLILVITFFITSAYGQETIDIFSISSRFGFPQSYDSIYKSKAKEFGSSASLVAPIKLSDKSIWYNSINYFYWHVSNDEPIEPGISNPIDLHGIMIQNVVTYGFF